MGGNGSDQFVAALGPSHEFLVEDAALALARHEGTVSHERKAPAVSRRVWLLMAAW